MATRRALVAGLLVSATFVASTPTQGSAARGCSEGAAASGDIITVHIKCKRAANKPPKHENTRPLLRLSRKPACPAGLTAYTRWVKTRTTWTSAPKVVCLSGPPTDTRPAITGAMVLRALRTVRLPHPTPSIQPARRTLVNLDTIFSAPQAPLTRTVTLLGQRVTLRIRPTRWVWEYGDGHSATTTTGGAAYPNKTIAYRYQRAAKVQPRVSITWAATYRINGGASQPVAGTVTTTGPSALLRVLEAVPVLSGR